MKFTFTPDQTHWLHERMIGLVYLAGKNHDAQAISRTASKMRYKFHGSPSLVFLGKKERDLVGELAIYTAESGPVEERPVAKSIMEVLSNVTSNDNADPRES